MDGTTSRRGSDPSAPARPDRAPAEDWPVGCWNELADRCARQGLALPVVAFFRLLGELRGPARLRIAEAKIPYLHVEHLAAATGHLDGLLLELRCRDVPQDAVPHLISVHHLLLEEMRGRPG